MWPHCRRNQRQRRSHTSPLVPCLLRPAGGCLLLPKVSASSPSCTEEPGAIEQSGRSQGWQHRASPAATPQLLTTKPATVLLGHITAPGLDTSFAPGETSRARPNYVVLLPAQLKTVGSAAKSEARDHIARFWQHFSLCHVFKHCKIFLACSMGEVYFSSGLGNLG